MKAISRTLCVIIILLILWVWVSTTAVTSQNCQPGATYPAWNFYSVWLDEEKID